ncbi:MAG: ribonuclease Y [Nitrospirota bacterium]|nr:ribonuclease Y [Nitrospirota bacterium]
MNPTDILLAVTLLASIGVIFVLLRHHNGMGRDQAEGLAARIVANAEREADVLRRAAELEVKDRRQTAAAEQESLAGREAEARRLHQEAQQQAAAVAEQEQQLARDRAQVKEQGDTIARTLERISGLSQEQAREALMERLESDFRFDAARSLARIEEEARNEADDRARHIISKAIQRVAGDYVVEATVTAINLPSDDLKGRIIGREGRNIRALETATGVNLIVDDTPETILISSFDPLRREVARRTLELLMADGRFQPTRIEDTVRSVEEKLDGEMREAANKILFELDIHDMHPDLVATLGRLKYRLSYGQNNLAHAREVGLICGMMADELGLDRKLAVRAGLLHDVGKVLSHDQEGGHAVLGAELAERCGEHPHVVNAIGSHHGDVKPVTKEAYLVAAGDALSAGRPGARRENMELYVKRLQNLEQVASSFPGVDRVYALQAGRELRVLVDAERLSDDECLMISRDIARRIEKEITFPGQIKVCLVRESRFIEYAR